VESAKLICNSFKDTSNLDHTMSNNWKVNNILVRMWKEEVVASFRVLFRYVSRGPGFDSRRYQIF
jgi:hypothetical protein